MRESLRKRESAATAALTFSCGRCRTGYSSLDAVRHAFKCPERLCEGEPDAALTENALDARLASARAEIVPVGFGFATCFERTMLAVQRCNDDRKRSSEFRPALGERADARPESRRAALRRRGVGARGHLRIITEVGRQGSAAEPAVGEPRAGRRRLARVESPGGDADEERRRVHHDGGQREERPGVRALRAERPRPDGQRFFTKKRRRRGEARARRGAGQGLGAPRVPQGLARQAQDRDGRPRGRGFLPSRKTTPPTAAKVVDDGLSRRSRRAGPRGGRRRRGRRRRAAGDQRHGGGGGAGAGRRGGARARRRRAPRRARRRPAERNAAAAFETTPARRGCKTMEDGTAFETTPPMPAPQK